MPFIHVAVAGAPLEADQIAALQRGVTRLMAEVLDKVEALVGVLVEQVPASGWSVGGLPVPCVAHVEATVSAGTNTSEQKARFVAEAYGLLRDVLGPTLSEVSYVVLHEVARDSWGYGGRTQADRAGPDRQPAWGEAGAED